MVERSRYISARVSREEYDEIVKRARIYGLSTSEYIRRVALSLKLPKVKEFSCVNCEGVEKALRGIGYEMHKIGININQIAKYVNTTKPSELDIQILERLKNIEKMVVDIHRLSSELATSKGGNNGDTD